MADVTSPIGSWGMQELGKRVLMGGIEVTAKVLTGEGFSQAVGSPFEKRHDPEPPAESPTDKAGAFRRHPLELKDVRATWDRIVIRCR